MNNKTITSPARRHFIKNSVGTAIACSGSLALSESFAASWVMYIRITDQDTQYTQSYNFLQWQSFCTKVLGVIVGNVVSRLIGKFGNRYPTFDIDACVRAALLGTGVLSIANYYTPGTKDVNIARLIGVMSATLAPALASSFGNELIQLELRKQGFSENRAKWAGSSLSLAFVGVFQYYLLPSCAGAIERVLNRFIQPNLRRRLKSTGVKNYAPVNQLVAWQQSLVYNQGGNGIPNGWAVYVNMPTKPDDSNWYGISPVYPFSVYLFEPLFPTGHNFSTDSIIYTDCRLEISPTIDGKNDSWIQEILGNVDVSKLKGPHLK